MSPSPNVQCFQNFFAILNALIIVITPNNGGKSSDSAHRPDIPPSWKKRTILYTGINTHRPDNFAFSNTLHDTIIIKIPAKILMSIADSAAPPIATPSKFEIESKASGVMLPVIAVHSTIREKSIFCSKINKTFLLM